MLNVCSYGIDFDLGFYSSNSTLKNNTLLNNTYNFGVSAWDIYSIKSFYLDIDNSNTINGKPIYYVIEENNLTFDGNLMNIGFLGLISCDNISIKNLKIGNNIQGLLLVNTTFSKITNCTFSNNSDQGILLLHSQNTQISKCEISNNAEDGIYISGNSRNNKILDIDILKNKRGIYLGSSNNQIVNCNISDNLWEGISSDASKSQIMNCTILNNSNVGIGLDSYADNQITSCTILNSSIGISLRLSKSNISNCIISNNSDGISLSDSSSNQITNCTVSNNSDDGIYLSYSSNNQITHCTILKNSKGIHLSWDSSSNSIYHNNFINNTKQAYTYYGGVNSWDNGPVDGGNYWSDHKCTGNPSNGSQPYYIWRDNIDHYPFEDVNGWFIISIKFDTGEGTYPSIMGVHSGTIKPSHDINVSLMYTYPCAGTGGHSEYVRIYGNGVDVSGTWNGYRSDYHNITFPVQFTLLAGHTYNYTIRTGSYPQIHHNRTLTVPDGEITCTEFIDANGKKYDNWILAIRLE